MMLNSIFLLFVVGLSIFLVSCSNNDPDSDSILLLDKTSTDATPDACVEQCHIAGDFLDPIRSNGQGTDGKHKKHVGERGYACYKCHYKYEEISTHRDGVLDTSDDGIPIVDFDLSRNPIGEWVQDTGPDGNGINTGSCSDLYCHGGILIPNWYEDSHWICSDCHTSGSFIDPLTTNGTGSSGKHTLHVDDHGIDCQRCHENYPKRSSHANGKFGHSGISAVDNNQIEIPVETETFVFFGGDFSGKTVTTDFETLESGSCDNVSCHASQAATNWYSP